MSRKLKIVGFNQMGLSRTQALAASETNPGIMYFTNDNAIVINGVCYALVRGATIGRGAGADGPDAQGNVAISSTGILELPRLPILNSRNKIPDEYLEGTFVDDIIEIVTAYWYTDRYYRPFREGELVDVDTFYADPSSYTTSQDYFDPSEYDEGTIIDNPHESAMADRYKVWKNDGSIVGSAHYESATFSKGKIYVNIDSNREYRWGGQASGLVPIVASPGSTDEVPEGEVNLYFTTDRTRIAIVGSSNTTNRIAILNALISDTSDLYLSTRQNQNLSEQAKTNARANLGMGNVLTDLQNALTRITALEDALTLEVPDEE